MKMITFAHRNTKEILRDPLNLAFGLGFPLVLLFLLSAIQRSVPQELYVIQDLTPGITVFGLSFISLSSAIIISKDRGSSFLQRLYTTPLTAGDFILGYTIPMLPISLLQSIVCYLAALLMGLKVSVNILWAVLGIFPVSVMFIAFGLLCGSILTDKQVGGVCGALLTNLTGWLSGIWFDLALVGGAFQKIAQLLPFVHAVEMERALLTGNFAGVFPHILWVVGYAVVLTVLAVYLFLRQMNRQ